MPTDFGTLLAKAIKDAGLSANQFAGLVAFDQPSLVKTIKGTRKPPAELIEPWADALGLRGADRQAFVEAGHLTHASEQVRALVDRLRAELADRPARRPRQPRR